MKAGESVWLFLSLSLGAVGGGGVVDQCKPVFVSLCFRVSPILSNQMLAPSSINTGRFAEIIETEN